MSSFIKDIQATLTKQDITIIELAEPIEDASKTCIKVESNLNNFSSLLKALDISMVFEIVYQFSSSYLYLSPDSVNEDNIVRVPLTSLSPDFERFVDYEGEDCSVTYYALSDDKIFLVDLNIQWWYEFLVLRTPFIENVNKLHEEATLTAQNVIIEYRTNLIEQLYQLVKDKSFRAFVIKDKQTIRAITSYALEEIAELNELPEKYLKEAVRNCIDCINRNKSMKPKSISIDYR